MVPLMKINRFIPHQLGAACLLVVVLLATVVKAWVVVPSSSSTTNSFRYHHRDQFQYQYRLAQRQQVVTTTTTTTSTLLKAGKNNKNNNGGGYKFGDITRSLGRKITGDQNYQVGDISKKLDRAAKAKVNELTGHKEYKFGDLSKWADSQVKEKVTNYTGKANYKVGDISKEVVRRVRAGDYNLEDVVLMLRVLLQMGVSLSPIGRLLPMKVLLEILNVGLAQDVGGRVMGGVASSLDERFKEAITGDAKYKLGDKSKQKISETLSKFTGKDSYSFGDISQLVASRMADEANNNNNISSSGAKETKSSSTTTSDATTTKNEGSKDSVIDTDALVELLNNEALEEWDRRLLESKTNEKNKPNKK